MAIDMATIDNRGAFSLRMKVGSGERTSLSKTSNYQWVIRARSIRLCWAAVWAALGYMTVLAEYHCNIHYITDTAARCSLLQICLYPELSYR